MGSVLTTFWARAFTSLLTIAVTISLGLASWIALDHLRIREELHKDYVTKAEHVDALCRVEKGIDKVVTRLDRMIDRELQNKR